VEVSTQLLDDRVPAWIVTFIEHCADHHRFYQVQVSEIPVIELGCDVAKGLFRGVITHSHETSHRCQADSNAFGTYFRGHGFHDFKQQPRTVFDTSPVAITSLIAGAVDELVEQVAVARVNFHTIHTGQNRVASGPAEVGNDRFDPRNVQRLRDRYITPYALALFIQDEGLAGHWLRGRCHRQAAVRLEHRVRHSPHMPELQENASAFCVYGLADSLPALNLLVAMDAGRPGVTLALLRNLCSLGNDQCSTGTLTVVLDVHRCRYVARLPRSRASQRRHDDAVIEGELAEFDRAEQVMSHDDVLNGLGLKNRLRRLGFASVSGSLFRWAARH